LIAGAITLYAVKGGNLHRKCGLIFVAAMLLMAATGSLLAVLTQERTSVMGGVLVLYLVLTSVLTIRRPARRFDWAGIVAALAALSISFAFFALAFEGLNSTTGMIDGLPPQPMLVFGAVALMAGLGDLRVTLAPEVRRPYRIARHLWRMCFALLMAAVSFFLGQPQMIPELFRHTALLATPPLAVVVLMLYWVVRVRWGNSFRRCNRAAMPEA